MVKAGTKNSKAVTAEVSSTTATPQPARSCCTQVSAVEPVTTTSSALQALNTPGGIAVAVGAGVLALAGLKAIYDTPSRTYNNNVGQEYDAWTEEGVLEYYWGEHIHLGYYNEEERAKGAFKKDFKKAKYDFIDEMLNFSEAKQPTKILDVGCGIGGTSRHLAKKFPNATVKGISLSQNQVNRGNSLAAERGLTNCSFEVMDALDMKFEDDTFDLVWACESGEHMPDKKKYVEEMTRVLKPGGTLVIACWCQREETPTNPFTPKDRKDLQFLYDEWAHPYFISVQEFGRLMEGTGKMESIKIDDWTPQTLDTWRHSIWVGVVDPWIVVGKPHIWYKTTREIVTIERMHQAFARGLMEYGMARGTKVASSKQLKSKEEDKVLVKSS